MNLGPYFLGPNDTLENGIYTGDAKILAGNIPDNSIDLIFTDPVYQNIEDYNWLAEASLRLLKPTGQVLVYQAHKWLPETMKALEPLKYIWTLGERMTRHARYWPLNMFICWRPLLWYAKEAVPFNKLGPDFSTHSSRFDSNFKWDKGVGHIVHWLLQLTKEYDIVVDFFCGGGAIPASCYAQNRHWLGFEINSDTAKLARKRVRETELPLFSKSLSLF